MASHSTRVVFTDEENDNMLCMTAISPRFVANGKGNDVIVWNVSTGESRRFQGHTDLVMALAFSTDGRVLVTGGEDRTARLWDVATGDCLLSLTGHTYSVYGVAFSPDGTKVATGSWDNTVRVCDATTGKLYLTLRHDDRVYSVAFSPDGKWILTGSADGTARLWDTTLGQFHLTTRHDDMVLSVAFSPDGNTIATGSRDCTARIWNVATGEHINTLVRELCVNGIVLLPDGKIVIAAPDEALQIFDVATGVLLEEYSDCGWNVASSTNGDYLAICSAHKTVVIQRVTPLESSEL